MTTLHAPDVTDKFTTRRIRQTAKALVEDGTFKQSDLDDVIQELQLSLISQVGNFDPERARWSTFVKTVVRHAATTLRRRQLADFRQEQAQYASLNSTIADDDGQLVELGATVSEEEHRTGLGMDFVTHTVRVHLSLDVEIVMNRLPTEVRQICKQLKTKSICELARELGIPKTTLLRRLELAREHFQRAGLGDVA